MEQNTEVSEILSQLRDKELAYVKARRIVFTDNQASKSAGLGKWIYDVPEDRRNQLNKFAERLQQADAKAIIVNKILLDASEEAAQVKVAGLKSRDERVKQAAATEIIDRSIGKTEQPISGEVNIIVTVKGNGDIQD